MRIQIDTTEAFSFELVEPGPYALKVNAIGDVAEGPNSKYVTVEFEFADPQIAKQAGKMWRNYPITGKGAGFFREFWKAATGEDIPLNTQIDVDTDEAIGAMVMGNVTHEEYEGKTRNVPGTLTQMQ